MDSVLERLTWDSCLIEPRPDRELEAYSRRKAGMTIPSVRYFAPVPWVARAVIDMHAEFGLLMNIDQLLADLLVLIVSQENSCRFCYAAQRAMLWAQGMSETRIQRIEQEFSGTALAPKVSAAVAFARNQSRIGPAGAAQARAGLRAAGVSDGEMKEIAFVVANTDFLNRLHTMLAIPSRSMERMPEQWHMRLLRPLIKRVMQKHRSRGKATPLPPVTGLPHARLVSAYAGSPIGAALARLMEGMWASPHLTRRCKLLIFAVIARGLGCEPCASELGGALQRETSDAAALETALTHLESPGLDDGERVLLPFARETIWYEPTALQRRTRALREHLSTEQLIEAIGVAALANGLCRMNAVLMAA
jgi:AhpD family alkylhydroperoxidase